MAHLFDRSYHDMSSIHVPFHVYPKVHEQSLSHTPYGPLKGKKPALQLFFLKFQGGNE
jgi:hypothetical protein